LPETILARPATIIVLLGPVHIGWGGAKVELAAITSPKEHRNDGINQEWKIYERQSEMFSYKTDLRYTAH